MQRSVTPSVETPRPSVSTASGASSDAVARLTPLGWTRGLVVIVVLIAASFFLAGYFVIYWRSADMDLVVVYNALAMNDGRAQTYFDHPAYITILAVKLWYQLLHHLGLLDAWRLSAIPSAADVPAFDAAMTSAVRAGRVLAWLTATVFVVVFAGLARLITRDWRIATLAVFAFAFSGGVQDHVRILRSEMVAASFVVFALMILIIVARRATAWRPLAIALAAALCVLGLDNKIHAILLIAPLPALLPAFGATTGASSAFWDDKPRAWLAAAAAAVGALLLAAAAFPLLRAGLNPPTTASIQPLLGGVFGLYQAALAVWIGGSVLAFAAIWRVSASETLATLCAIVAGASLGLLALAIRYDVNNVVVVVNPLEKMLQIADLHSTEGGGIWTGAGVLVSGVVGVLRRYSFVLMTSPRPTIFLTWLIVPGIVWAWRRGERQVALQAALLILTAMAIDSLGVRRGLKVEYFVFTDPLIILAGALLLTRMTWVRSARWTYPIGVVLIALSVGISQAEPVKRLLLRSGPEGVCDWNQTYLPLLPLPWCALPPKRP